MTETLHIYTRVSSRSQEEEGTGLDEQRESGIQRSKELGFNFEVHNEGSQSSFNDDLTNREVLIALLDQIQEGKIKHLYVYHTDRLSRNENTFSNIRYILKKNDVRLYVSNGNDYKLNSSLDNLTFGILSEFNRFENELRTERLRLGKIRRIREGFYLNGSRVFGYQIVNKKLVADKHEKKWVKKIFEMYRDGSSTKAIQQHLLINGVQTVRRKSGFSLGSIEQILRNTHYVGYFYWEDKKTGEKIRCTCESLISNKLFEDVRKVRETRSYKNSGKRAADSNLTHITLKDFLVCGCCGSRYRQRVYKKQYRSNYYCSSTENNYREEGTERFKNCSNRRYMKIEETDNLIWETVTSVLKDSHRFKETIRTKVLKDNSTFENSSDLIEKNKKKIRSIDRELKQISDNIVEVETNRVVGKLNEDQYAQILENIDSIRRNLESQKEILTSENRGLSSERNWVDWVKKFGERIDQLSSFSTEEKRDFLEGVLDSITVDSIDAQTHELIFKFKVRYVGDELVWNDAQKKSEGYKIVGGTDTLKITGELGTDLSKKSAA